MREKRSLTPAVAAGACVLLFAAVYLFFVRTHAGQAFEFDALKGSPALADTPAVLRARTWLSSVTEYTMAFVIVLVLVIGLVRRRPALAVLGAAVVIVTAVLDRVLVNWVLTRPTLVEDRFNRENSFPSGHVAMAMSALLAVLIVVPYTWRAVTALVGSVLVLGVAAMTMTLGWHRLSDTIGGNLIALGVAALGLAVLVGRAGVEIPPPRRLLSHLLATIPLLVYAGWVALDAAGPAYDAVTHDASLSPHDHQVAVFEAAAALATVVSTLTVVTFLGLLAGMVPASVQRRVVTAQTT